MRFSLLVFFSKKVGIIRWVSVWDAFLPAVAFRWGKTKNSLPFVANKLYVNHLCFIYEYIYDRGTNLKNPEDKSEKRWDKSEKGRTKVKNPQHLLRFIERLYIPLQKQG